MKKFSINYYVAEKFGKTSSTHEVEAKNMFDATIQFSKEIRQQYTDGEIIVVTKIDKVGGSEEEEEVGENITL